MRLLAFHIVLTPMEKACVQLFEQTGLDVETLLWEGKLWIQTNCRSEEWWALPYNSWPRHVTWVEYPTNKSGYWFGEEDWKISLRLSIAAKWRGQNSAALLFKLQKETLFNGLKSAASSWYRPKKAFFFLRSIRWQLCLAKVWLFSLLIDFPSKYVVSFFAFLF